MQALALNFERDFHDPCGNPSPSPPGTAAIPSWNTTPPWLWSMHGWLEMQRNLTRARSFETENENWRWATRGDQKWSPDLPRNGVLSWLVVMGQQAGKGKPEPGWPWGNGGNTAREFGRKSSQTPGRLLSQQRPRKQDERRGHLKGGRGAVTSQGIPIAPLASPLRMFLSTPRNATRPSSPRPGAATPSAKWLSGSLGRKGPFHAPASGCFGGLVFLFPFALFGVLPSGSSDTFCFLIKESGVLKKQVIKVPRLPPPPRPSKTGEGEKRNCGER